MNTYGFSGAFGTEITRGWQGTDAQALAKAQQLANERNESVEYWIEGQPSAGSMVVQPARPSTTTLCLQNLSKLDLEQGLKYVKRADLDGRTFASRFAGPDNAGLRAKIRSVVASERCGLGNAKAVRLLLGVVTLTPFGQHTLEQVAGDYEATPSASTGKRTCDCDRCVLKNVSSIEVRS